jgi:hypothetical protein
VAAKSPLKPARKPGAKSPAKRAADPSSRVGRAVERTLGLAREHGLDAGLLLGALLCFGLFASNSLERSSVLSGSGGSIAALRAGDADQKRFGTPDFKHIGAGAPLFNRDAVWVGEGRTGLILYDDGSAIQVAQKTFIILRRGLGQNGDSGGVTLLQGSVEVIPASGLFSNHTMTVETAAGKIFKITGGAGATEVKSNGEIKGGGYKPPATSGDPATAPSSAPRASASPSSTPSPGASASPPAPETAEEEEARKKAARKPTPLASVTSGQPKVVPVPGSILFLITSRQTSVSFGWPQALTGTLVLENEAGATIAQVPLANAAFTKQTLPEGHTYTWRVRGPAGDTLHGPYEFSVLHFEQKALDEILRNDPRRTVEVLE